MKIKFTLFLFLFLCFCIKNLFSQDYSLANKLFTEKKYDEAEKMYAEILKTEPQNALANFGFARTIFLSSREIIFKKRNQNSIWESWKMEYERLKIAYSHAQIAQESYRKATSKEKKMFSVNGIADHKEINALMEGIPKEATDLITKSHFQKSYDLLMQIPPFNEPNFADTVMRLREIITELSIDFEATYKNNRNQNLIKNYRKVLLDDYITIPNLRRNGTGYGFLYEKFCNNTLKDCDLKNLQHITQEFYGADFDKDKNMNFAQFEAKLQEAATEMQQTPLEFLCGLNLHYKGVTDESKKHYEKFIEKIAPAEIAWVALQKLAGKSIDNFAYDEAIALYYNYSDIFPQKKNDIDEIVKILKTPLDNIQLTNLGQEINTDADETNPVAMPDGLGLFFGRKNHGSGQDILLANKKNGKFVVERIATPIHTSTHEVPINISFDKSQFVFFGNYAQTADYKDLLNTGKLGKGDLFYTKLAEADLRINVFPPPINSPDFEGGLCYTADGLAVIFVSDRVGAVGDYFPKSPPNRLFYHGNEEFNTDLWICFKKKGEWTEPINFGNTVNTPFAESNPYLHPDMKTLYFVSDGHAGLGGGDIFVSTRLDETWKNWSKPQNLGKSINTPYRDGFFMDAYGQFAYAALKNKTPNFGGTDIYRFEIPERFRPKKTVKISGNLLGSDGKVVSGKIIVEDLVSGNKVSESNSDAKTGRFEFELQSGKLYGVFSEKSGNLGESAALKLNEKFDNAHIRLESNSIKSIIDKQKTLQLRNIYFETNSYELRGESESELRRLAEMLKVNTNIKIRVEGYTDNVGNPNANLVLSEKRAKSVADYLIKLGCPATRAFYKGFGQEDPIAENQTEEGRAKNRRVEFSLKYVD